jgi:hypothetical protein
MDFENLNDRIKSGVNDKDILYEEYRLLHEKREKLSNEHENKLKDLRNAVSGVERKSNEIIQNILFLKGRKENLENINQKLQIKIAAIAKLEVKIDGQVESSLINSEKTGNFSGFDFSTLCMLNVRKNERINELVKFFVRF